MNWHDYENLPRRGQPKKPVKYTEHHALVLRSLFWHYRTGSLATDESIYECIVKFVGTDAISPSGARTRRHELEGEFKLAYRSGVKGKTRAGKKCSSYRLTQSGIDKARQEFDAAKQMRMVA
jgi:hypothetical protein